MRFLFPLLLLTGCGIPTTDAQVVEADPAPVLETMTAVQPEPLVALVENPQAEMGIGIDCPMITALESAPETLREHWAGGCILDDGLRVEGELERFDGPNGAWVSGNRFQVFQGDDLVFMLDGAIEISVSGDLWLIDAAAATCGAENWSCDAGTLSLDLAYTIYPAAFFPSDYDITVSGAFATEDTTYTLDGAWSVDMGICQAEPTHGMLSVQQGSHHAITLNGAEQCDGCLGWQVQGQPTPGLCGLNR